MWHQRAPPRASRGQRASACAKLLRRDEDGGESIGTSTAWLSPCCPNRQVRDLCPHSLQIEQRCCLFLHERCTPLLFGGLLDRLPDLELLGDCGEPKSAGSIVEMGLPTYRSELLLCRLLAARLLM